MEIIYTHDEGVTIRVSRFDQRVVIGSVTLGPFEPFDLAHTVDAICAHARETGRPSLMRAAEDWQIVNTDDGAIAKRREKTHGWEWESPDSPQDWCA